MWTLKPLDLQKQEGKGDFQGKKSGEKEGTLVKGQEVAVKQEE